MEGGGVRGGVGGVPILSQNACVLTGILRSPENFEDSPPHGGEYGGGEFLGVRGGSATE